MTSLKNHSFKQSVQILTILVLIVIHDNFKSKNVAQKNNQNMDI